MFSKYNVQSSIEYVNDRLGHDFRYAIDSSKIQKLGWKPSNNFKEKLHNTIDWYMENKEVLHG